MARKEPYTCQVGESMFCKGYSVYHRPDGLYMVRKQVKKQPLCEYGANALEAVTKLEEAIAKAMKGVVNSKMLFRHYVTEYLDGRTGLSHRTKKHYRGILNTHVLPVIGDTRLKDLDGNKKPFNQIVYVMRKNGKSPATQYIAIYYCRQILDAAVEEKLIEINAASKVDTPKRDDYVREKKALDAETAIELIDYSAKHKYSIAVPLGIYLNLREGEVCGLKWGDIDFKRKNLRLRETWGKDRKDPTPESPNTHDFGDVKTTNSKRDYDLSDDLIDLLLIHKEKQEVAKAKRKKRMKDKFKYADLDMVLAQPNGNPVSPDSLCHMLKPMCKALGIKEICFHDLRRTYATLAEHEGIGHGFIAQAMGQKDTRTLNKSYIIVGDKTSQLATYAVGNTLSAAKAIKRSAATVSAARQNR